MPVQQTGGRPVGDRPRYFVDITNADKKTVRVATWAAGWAPEALEELRARYKACSARP